jgi:signal transduction histidine kinase
MRSIRRRLTLWLLGGLALLWLAAGAGVYLSVRQSLIKSIDADLAVDARIVRFTARGEATTVESASPRRRGQNLAERLTDYHQPGGGSFYQVWNSDGEVIETSSSIGDITFARPRHDGADPVFATQKLPDGRSVRTMTFGVAAAGGKGPGKGKGRPGAASTTVILGKDLSGLESSMKSLLGGIGLVGALAAACTILLVSLALRHGLRPLRVLGEQVQAIDAPSLHARFDAAHAPAELKPIYTALNDLLQRLELGFERERRFSADLAHEMRTPVAELKMISEVALKWPEQADASTHEQSLEIANQLESLIETLLSLARLESGEAELQITTVNVGALIQECWQIYATAADAKGLQATIKVDEFAVMETDARLLRVILTNLLSNAVEYTPTGGSVKARVTAEGIEIANTAPAMTQDDVPHLFDRFWRAEQSRSNSSSHSGLGLALARQAARALGYELTAELREGLLHFTLKSFATSPSRHLQRPM